MNALEDTLQKLARVLEELDIPYMVIGGMANAIWGEPRATLDVDVTVWVDEQDISDKVSGLQKKFIPLVSDPVSFIKDTRVLPLKTENDIRIDLIFGLLPFEKTAIGRAVEISIGESQVRFCSPEDLILHKIISDRGQDHNDARGVTLRRLKTLDLEYLEPKILELSKILERPEIWAKWLNWKKEGDEANRC